MSRFFCNAIANSLLQPFKVFVEKSLIFEEHCVGFDVVILLNDNYRQRRVSQRCFRESGESSVKVMGWFRVSIISTFNF